MENKNIDNIFKDKLSGLDASPNKRVWANIESKLKKKKRRVLPIWWLSGGVAASLIIGFLLLPFKNNNSNNDKIIQPVIIAAPNKNQENLNTNKNKIDTLINTKKENIFIVEEKNNNKPQKRKKKEVKTRKQQVLIAETNSKKNETKEIVSKKAMKENFLNKNKFQEKLDSIKNKNLITQQINIDTKKTDFILKNKKQEVKEDFKAVVYQTKEEEEKKLQKRWSVSPVVAVLNSNSFSKSSPINASLNNTTKGNSSYSYGVNVSYQLHKKWSIQTGIHLQEIAFSNNNVIVSSTNSSNSNVSFNSGDSFALEDATNLNSSSISLSAISLDGVINQEYGYLEVPIEIKYSIIESKKIKTQLVTGFSSLFLNKNNIQLNANSISRKGKANNLNSINFSGNFGIDFNYKINKRWSLNLNPMFKTQLNTFHKNSNGFKPYFIGFYSGVNFSF